MGAFALYLFDFEGGLKILMAPAVMFSIGGIVEPVIPVHLTDAIRSRGTGLRGRDGDYSSTIIYNFVGVKSDSLGVHY